MKKCGKKLSAAIQCWCIALLTVFIAASAGAQTTGTHDARLRSAGPSKSPLGIAPSPIAGRLLSAAPAPQQFYRPLVIEPEQGLEPEQLKSLGQRYST